ncbi:hypothetical protein FBU59_005857 [Linderina macrospora]|uniref:Uncharacterized protein n=1 Tax=Linderina macrospora TaxID=4868 RepID=A0ACC1J1D4_9FUNG|nr:hypothetical protein FBU59_005857 [Linderina macrospora]
MGRSAKTTNKTSRGKVTPYRIFFDQELKRLKEENPKLAHKDAFKQAGLNWRTSPQNPKVNPAAAAAWEKTKAEAEAVAAVAAAAAEPAAKEKPAASDEAAPATADKPAAETTAAKATPAPKESKDTGFTSMAAHAVPGAVAAK